MLFVQLGDLHVYIHVVVSNNLSVPLLVGTSFIDRFVKEIFPMKRRITPIQSHPLTIISEYAPRSDPMAASQTDSDAEIDTEGLYESNNKTLLFRVANCITTPPNIKASVSITTSIHGLIYVA